MQEIDFLAVGHVTRDRAPEGFRLGGTVSYAAVTARRLGWHPGIITSGAAGGFGCDSQSTPIAGVCVLRDADLDGVLLRLLPSPVSTTFHNVYHQGRRTQFVEAIAGPIEPSDLPPAWSNVRTALLGPMVNELSESWASAFPGSILGITPQGWMRRWDDRGHVSHGRWANAEAFLPHADVVVLSREDVEDDEGYISELAAMTPLLVITDGYHGAKFYQGGASFFVPARGAREIDPTGAGDVFATAFLLRYAETGDPLVATRFAHVVASMSVEGPAMSAIPQRQVVDDWLDVNGW